MAYPVDLPPLSDDNASRQWREMMLDTSKHNIQSNLVALSTAACGIYINTPTSNAEPNFLAIGMRILRIDLALCGQNSTNDVHLLHLQLQVTHCNSRYECSPAVF